MRSAYRYRAAQQKKKDRTRSRQILSTELSSASTLPPIVIPLNKKKKPQKMQGREREREYLIKHGVFHHESRFNENTVIAQLGLSKQ